MWSSSRIASTPTCAAPRAPPPPGRDRRLVWKLERGVRSAPALRRRRQRTGTHPPRRRRARTTSAHTQVARPRPPARGGARGSRAPGTNEFAASTRPPQIPIPRFPNPRPRRVAEPGARSMTQTAITPLTDESSDPAPDGLTYAFLRLSAHARFLLCGALGLKRAHRIDEGHRRGESSLR